MGGWGKQGCPARRRGQLSSYFCLWLPRGQLQRRVSQTLPSSSLEKGLEQKLLSRKYDVYTKKSFTILSVVRVEQVAEVGCAAFSCGDAEKPQGCPEMSDVTSAALLRAGSCTTHPPKELSTKRILRLYNKSASHAPATMRKMEAGSQWASKLQ